MTKQELENKIIASIKEIPEEFLIQVLKITEQIKEISKNSQRKSIIGTWKDKAEIVDQIVNDAMQARDEYKWRI